MFISGEFESNCTALNLQIIVVTDFYFETAQSVNKRAMIVEQQIAVI